MKLIAVCSLVCCLLSAICSRPIIAADKFIWKDTFGKTAQGKDFDDIHEQLAQVESELASLYPKSNTANLVLVALTFVAKNIENPDQIVHTTRVMNKVFDSRTNSKETFNKYLGDAGPKIQSEAAKTSLQFDENESTINLATLEAIFKQVHGVEPASHYQQLKRMIDGEAKAILDKRMRSVHDVIDHCQDSLAAELLATAQYLISTTAYANRFLLGMSSEEDVKAAAFKRIQYEQQGAGISGKSGGARKREQKFEGEVEDLISQLNYAKTRLENAAKSLSSEENSIRKREVEPKFTKIYKVYWHSEQRVLELIIRKMRDQHPVRISLEKMRDDTTSMNICASNSNIFSNPLRVMGAIDDTPEVVDDEDDDETEPNVINEISSIYLHVHSSNQFCNICHMSLIRAIDLIKKNIQSIVGRHCSFTILGSFRNYYDANVLKDGVDFSQRASILPREKSQLDGMAFMKHAGLKKNEHSLSRDVAKQEATLKSIDPEALHRLQQEFNAKLVEEILNIADTNTPQKK